MVHATVQSSDGPLHIREASHVREAELSQERLKESPVESTRFAPIYIFRYTQVTLLTGQYSNKSLSISTRSQFPPRFSIYHTDPWFHTCYYAATSNVSFTEADVAYRRDRKRITFKHSLNLIIILLLLTPVYSTLRVVLIEGYTCDTPHATTKRR
jgi:hypothetical protein